MASLVVQKTFPQTGVARVIDDIEIHGPDQATGYFQVKLNDPRVSGNYEIMSMGLILEFALQTGTPLLMQGKSDSLPCFQSNHLEMAAAALPGDSLVCVLRVTARHGRKMSFSSGIYKTNNGACELIANVSFTGTTLSRRVIKHWEKRTFTYVP